MGEAWSKGFERFCEFGTVGFILIACLLTYLGWQNTGFWLALVAMGCSLGESWLRAGRLALAQAQRAAPTEGERNER